LAENERDILLEKALADFYFDTIDFDKIEANPYEIVVAVAKKAREINDKAHKYLGPEVEVRPTVMALKKLNKGNVKFIYTEEEQSKSEIPEQEE
jgi:DNA-directed RNA polymerase omega subunit